MTARTGKDGPRLLGRGPTLRGTAILRLPDDHGFVSLPRPTMQYGGVMAYPPGTVLRIDIGNARGCSDWSVENLAGALCECAEVEVIGTDPYAVAETTDALRRAMRRWVSPAC
ncbi:hypothetical protein [Streptomyces sp. 049-1]|uniref:hypothetical protein n=1 Tax=Streptomyces sp. 049-1 TaxID=2789264 RepID=UPI00397FE0EF